jgi:hypothetical protein
MSLGVSKGGQQQKTAFSRNARSQNGKREKHQPLPETYKNLLPDDDFPRFRVHLSITIIARSDDP